MAWVTKDLLLILPVFVLAALHPRVRDLFQRPDFHPDTFRWAVVGAVPWAVYALMQAQLQFRPALGDIHGGIEHWGTAFMMVVAVISWQADRMPSRGQGADPPLRLPSAQRQCHRAPAARGDHGGTRRAPRGAGRRRENVRNG